jgi:hypothetical protein
MSRFHSLAALVLPFASSLISTAPPKWPAAIPSKAHILHRRPEFTSFMMSFVLLIY